MKKYFKKVVFAFICLFAVGIMNVDAKTITVTTEEQFREYAKGFDNTITEIKLGADITLTDLTPDISNDNYLLFNITDGGLILDLAGHTLNVEEIPLSFYYGMSDYDESIRNYHYYTSGTLTLTDSSNSNSGKIVTKDAISLDISDSSHRDVEKNYGFVIDGGTYITNFTTGSYPLIFELFSNDYYSNNNKITFNFELKKGNFEMTSGGFVFYTPRLDDSDIQMNFKIDSMYVKGDDARIATNRFSKLSIDEVSPSTTKVYNTTFDYSTHTIVEEEITDRTTTLYDIKSATRDGAYIKFAISEGFNASSITLNEVYGYSSATAKNISIQNVGTSPLQIKNVTVDSANFIVVNGNQATLEQNGIDTSWSIKAKEGLNAGTYTGIITITDMNDKTYTATVELKIYKKEITPSINLVSSWEYGESVTPVVNGAEMLNESEYSVIYALKNNANWNTKMPKKVGSYVAKLTINSNNYYASESTVDFEIKKTTKVLKIVANSSEHVYDGNEYTDPGYKVYFDGVEVTDRNETGHILPTGDILKPIEIIGSVTYVSDNYENNNKIKDLSSLDNYNYYENIEMINGTIKILKNDTPVVIKPIDVEKDFDGNNSTPSKLVATGLVSGDEIGGTIKNIGIYAGEYESEVGAWWITRTVDGRTYSVTDCYSNVTTAKGSVKVHPATREFTINDINVLVNEHLSYSELKDKLNLNVYTHKNPTFRKISGEGTYDLTNGFNAPSSEGVTVMEVILFEENTGGDDTPEYKEVKKQFNIIASEKESLTISGLTDNQQFTYDGTTKTPWGTGTITVEDNKVDVNELEITYKGTGSTSYNSKFAPVDAGTYTITYKVKDSNPNYVGSVTYAFTIKKAQLNKPTASTTSFVYDGTSKGYSSFHDNETFEFTGTNTATNVGNYSLTISLKDKNNYEWKDGTTTDVVIDWSITQTTPDFTVPTGLVGVKGDFLRSIALPYGFTWNNPNELLNAGTHTYKATYTPADTTNYKTVTDIDVTVVVKNKFVLAGIVNGGNGTISVSSLEVLEGEKAEVVFTPDTGYMIDKVLVEGTEVEVTGNKLELTMDGNKLVTVSYKKIPFTVTVKDVTGATITPNGAVSVNYGDNKEFTITVNSGYKLVKVLVNGTDKTADMIDDKLTLSNITANMELEVVVEKIVYEVTEGANQKYTISKSTEAKFVIDANYRDFNSNSGVYIDDVLVDSENYTSFEENGTVITLKKEFVDSLTIGEHTFKTVFSDGGEATTTFTVANVTSEIDNPKTGDNILLYIITSIASLLGLIGIGIFTYKRKQTN